MSIIMKKLLTTIISILLIVTLNSNVVFGDPTVYTDGALNYVINDDGSIEITEYFGDYKEYTIPRSIGGITVTRIADKAFKDKTLDKIELPDTIEYVSPTAFDSVKGLDVKFYDINNEYVDKDDILESIGATKVDNNNSEVISNNNTDKKVDNNESNIDIVEEENIDETIDIKDDPIIDNTNDDIGDSEGYISEDEINSIGEQVEEKPDTSNNSYIYIGVIVLLGVFIIIYKNRHK